VQYGQEKFTITETNVAIVRSTSGYKYSDKYHYKSDGYIDLGKEFAKAVFLLNKKKFQ
jgi:hypothetical protein